VGRNILTPAVFEALERTAPDKNGEIQLTDALSLLLKEQALYALELEGRRYDTGSPQGWLEAQVAYGIKNQEFGDRLRENIRKLI
jgi:UTP--glucose-1-phosphate uridylyltransferase